MENQYSPICYGALITLKSPEDYYLCAQGFIDQSPYLQKHISQDFSGAIFRIIPNSTYSVQNEIISFVQEINENNINEKIDRLAKLEDSLEGEIKTNMQRYVNARGTPIRYDSPIQLEHLQSHKFLTLECSDTADIEKENLKVSLEDFTSGRSHFRIVPGFNYQKFTDGVVKNHDKVYLEILVADVRKVAFLHSSRSYSEEILMTGIYSLLVPQEKIQNYLEVNISFDQKTRWELAEFSQSPSEDLYLECGDYIWMAKPEESVVLSVKKERKNGIMFTSNSSDTNGLWMVENIDPTRGGLIEIGTACRLRHISTKFYLAINAKSKLVLSEEICTGSAWAFFPLEPEGKYLRIDEIGLIINTDTQRTINVEPITYHISTSIHNYSEKSINEDAVYKITRAGGEVVWETLFLLHCYPILTSFNTFIDEEILLNGPDAYKTIHEFKKKADMIETCLCKLNEFCNNKLQGMIGIDKHLRDVQLSRQKMLKEHNFFEVLANMLDTALKDPIDHEKIRIVLSQREKSQKNPKKGVDLETVRLKQITKIVKSIYILLITLCHKCKDNQNYAYLFFQNFIKHIGIGLGASGFVLALLKDNEQLMLSVNTLKSGCEGIDAIEFCTNFLYSDNKETRVEILNFLKNICVFKGNGVTVNQEKIFECLFKNNGKNCELVKKIVIDKQSLCFVLDCVVVPIEAFFEENRIAAFDKDTTFFTKLLELYANMCIGRNFEVSAELTKLFPFELIHSLVWNSSLTDEIRGAFCKLLLNLYIDCSPREEISKPQLIKEFKENELNLDVSARLETMSAEVKKKNDLIKIWDDFGESLLLYPSKEKVIDALPPVHEDFQVYKLLEKIFEFFDSKPGYSELTCEIIRLTSKLVKFGLLGDSSTDFEKEILIQNPEYQKHELDIVRIMKAVVPLLFGIERKVSRMSIIRKRSTKIEVKHKSSQSSRQMAQLSSLLQTNASLKDPLIRSAANLKNSITGYKQNPFASIEKKTPEYRIMLKICRMLHFYLDCRQEFLLNNFVTYFNKNEENIDLLSETYLLQLLPQVMKYPKKQAEFHDYFNGIYGHSFTCITSPLIPDLNALSPKSLILTLLQLFVDSKNYKLQSSVLLLILRCYEQRKEMLKFLSVIHPISKNKDIELLYWLKQNIKTFKEYSERSELWISYWRHSGEEYKTHYESFKAILGILKDLESVLYENTHVENGNLSPSTDTFLSVSRQKMMNYLGVHQLVLTLIKDGIHELIAFFAAKKKNKHKEQLVGLFKLCFSFLMKFVMQNTQNQKKIYKNVHFFLQNLNLQLGEIPLICEIFRENLKLIERIDENFLGIFRNLIVKYGRRSMFLEFFKVIQVVNGKAVPSIQRIVLNMFIQEELDMFLLYMNEGSEYGFSFEVSENPDPEYIDEPYAYHANLLKVLEKCGYGVTGMYFNEAKCQNIVKLSSIFYILFKAEDESSPFAVLKNPTLGFFFSIYLDCEIINLELKSCKLFFDYIYLQSEVLEKATNISKKYTKFLSIFLNILLQYRTSYIKKNDSLYNDSLAIRTFLDSLILNSKKFESIILPQNFLQTVNDLCDSFGVSFAFVGEETELSFDLGFKFKRSSSVRRSVLATRSVRTWTEVCDSISYNERFKERIEDEEYALVLIINFIGHNSSNLNFERIVSALIQFIHLSRSQQPPISLTLNAIELLARIISNPVHNKYTEPAEAKRKLQNDFISYGIVRVIFTLMCDTYVELQIFKSLMIFSIDLLDGGNTLVQSEIYFFFNNTANSEVLFERMHQIFFDFIDKFVHSQSTGKFPKIFKKKHDDIQGLLRFLQLLCEGHNLSLQNYIRFQSKSRNSYDMISDTISLLEILLEKKLFTTFQVISQCLDTLTEFIQGPCMKNQESIIDGKFLELANVILSLDENSSNCKSYEIIKKNEYVENTIEDIIVTEEVPKCLSNWMIAHLKYKCMITILGLVEGRTDSYVTTRLIRAFNLEILKENLKSIYMAYVEYYKSNYYNNNIFNHTKNNYKYVFGVDTNKQDLNPKKYSLIVETGFMIYHLLKIFLESDDPESQDIISGELEQLHKFKEIEGFSNTLVESNQRNTELSDEVIKNSISAVKYYTNTKELEINREICYNSTFNFFDKYTGKIEVVFNGNIFRVYFPLPAEFKGLTPEIRAKFHRNVDRDTDQTKLKYLLKKTESIIEQIQHEYRLINAIQNNRIISLVASKVYIWRDIAFALTVALNICVLLSYSIFNDSHRMDEPALFNLAYNSSYLGVAKTEIIIRFLGITQLVCCIIIVMFFLLKVGPIVAKKGWRKHNPTVEYLKSNPNLLKRTALKAKQIIWTVAHVLKNFPVLYHIAYMIFSVLGIFTHPFYFSLLLLDILYKYPSLQNVVKSFLVPRKALLLTFCLMVVLMYMFAILGYMFFQDDFNHSCATLFWCTITLWDASFKSSGMIGGSINQFEDGDFHTSRFFYDNIYNILLDVIIMGVVEGLIIDTFAMLREEQEKSSADKEMKCFICGLERDFIERKTNMPFSHHTEIDHNEWNYVFFIAYLLRKDETEYTGLESYVKEQYDRQELTWIPNLKTLSIKDMAYSEEIESLQIIEKMQEKIKILEDQIKILKGKNRV